MLFLLKFNDNLNSVYNYKRDKEFIKTLFIAINIRF